MCIAKRSVTRSIAQALSAIVLLSLLTTGLALVTIRFTRQQVVRQLKALVTDQSLC